MNATLPVADLSPYFASLTVRPLTAADSLAYRALRKRILDIGDGKYFSSSYTREAQFTTESQWFEWCTPTQEHCTIGAFVDGQLIGIMGIVMIGVPELRTAEWEATWLDPQYRRCGIAKHLYEKVCQWTKDHGYERAVSLIRADNMRSLEIRKKNGGIYIHTQHNTKWADGSIADILFFVTDLHSTAHQTRAICYLEETIAALQHEAQDAPVAAQFGVTIPEALPIVVSNSAKLIKIRSF